MKNTRKLISILLAVVMLMSVMSVAAFADGVLTSEDGLWDYIVDGDNAIITSQNAPNPAYHGNETVIVVPSEIDGYTITEIGDLAFAELTDVTNIYLPDTIIKISGEAFLSCYNLEWIFIPESVTEISKGAFNRSGLAYILGASGSAAEAFADDHDNTWLGDVEFVSTDDYNCASGNHCYIESFSEDSFIRNCMICGETETEELSLLSVGETTEINVKTVEEYGKYLSLFYYCYINITESGFYSFEFDGADCHQVDALCDNYNLGLDSYAFSEDLGEPLLLEEGEYLIIFGLKAIPENEIFKVKVEFNGQHRVESFPDMPADAWYYEAAMYNSDRNFITGYKNGNFGGADKLQRQDFIVILGRISGFDEEVFSSDLLSSGLEDVPSGQYYTSSVNWAVYRNIIKGYDNGKFGVGDSITREQVATILYRYMGSPEVTGADETLAPFADAGTISDFAKDAMVWAIQNNIISGKNATTLAPTATASRAEIATIVMRMDKAALFA